MLLEKQKQKQYEQYEYQPFQPAALPGVSVTHTARWAWVDGNWTHRSTFVSLPFPQNNKRHLCRIRAHSTSGPNPKLTLS